MADAADIDDIGTKNHWPTPTQHTDFKPWIQQS